MKIAYLDGVRYYRVLYAGIQSLLDDQDYLDKINVFPVPDGDTGTNMAFTLMGVIEHIKPHQQSPLNELSVLVAEAALDNARGNSGVILAQFFQGLSTGLRQFTDVNTSQFSEAVTLAVNESYQALMDPIEGTILSVLRAWSIQLKEASRTSADFQRVWEVALEAAQRALDHTPEQLPVLKEAGVVDAAGQGFLSILRGVMNYMNTGDIRRPPQIDTEFSSTALTMSEQIADNIANPFCTECIVAGDNISREQLNNMLKDKGDSIVIAGTQQRAKIHIHTKNPGKLFSVLAQFGTVLHQKVDDMREQNKSIRSSQRIALVVDSTCDLPPEILEKHHMHVVPVRLNFGKEQFIDRVTITNEEFYRRLSQSAIHPQSSHPPPADFSRMYQFLSSHYESVISLHLPQVLSGTLQNAVTALEKVTFIGQTKLLDALSISAGTGMIALETAEAIEAGVEYSQIIEMTEQAIQNTEIFIGLKTLDAVLRGSRLSVNKKRIIDLLRLNLILTVTKEGYLKPRGVTLGRNNLFQKFEKYVLKQTRGRAVKRIGIVHGMNPVVAKGYRETFSKIFPDAFVFVTDFCPALGVHGGVGAVGIALQYED